MILGNLIQSKTNHKPFPDNISRLPFTISHKMMLKLLQINVDGKDMLWS